ncbi:hypothetical protein D9611_013890 [Ephemerocybe angulata]|uniref:Uncharacterized protein n=1 Tax=Ephemerocybe angulata TaxID=980116 RepID=A0A8H5F9W0_9AGAR|nr:hypothetical protein D9611_013890 [Tulosesus angulatus]
MRAIKPTGQQLAAMSLADKIAFNATLQARNVKRADTGFTGESEDESLLGLEDGGDQFISLPRSRST